MKVFVPLDSAAVALGADKLASAIAAEGAARGVSVDVVRNGSRGMVWLEPLVEVEVCDAGTGFSPDTARRATEPFFSTRNVGLGLGLTVTRKIVEDHAGRLEIPASGTGASGSVKISLPLSEQI